MSRGACGCSCERTWEGDYSLLVLGEVVKGRTVPLRRGSRSPRATPVLSIAFTAGGDDGSGALGRPQCNWVDWRAGIAARALLICWWDWRYGGGSWKLLR